MSRRELAIVSAIVAGVFALVASLHFGGSLERFDHALAEQRAALASRTVESDIVIVGIDAHSIETLDAWPWPRRHHARLLQLLAQAAPAEVFFDIDFSSESPDPADDALFERELERFGAPVLLASHRQALRGDSGEISARRPLPRFREHVQEVSVVLEPDEDGIVRSVPAASVIDGLRMPAAFAIGGNVGVAGPASSTGLASPAGPDMAAIASVRIDFSIDPGSFDFVSYSDLLNAAVDLSALEGRRIYIGATSSELGDSVPVPRFQRVPGVVLQALAAETTRLGPLGVPPAWLFAALLAVWTAALAAINLRGSWRRNSLVGVASLVFLFAASHVLYTRFRIELDATPFLAISVALFVIAALRSLDRQTWRAMAYAIGVRRRDALLKSVIEASMDSIICVDDRGAIRTANPAASVLLGSPLKSLLGADIARFVPGLGLDFAARARKGAVSELDAVDTAGRRFPVEATLSRVGFENELLYTMFMRDISERKAQEKQLEYQARHDSLTGLPNRVAIREFLEDILAARDAEARVAVLLLDLCRFKEVNDTLGHEVGDEVLRVVGRRFREALGDDQPIGRIGGDEFFVVVPDVASRAAIEMLADNLFESLRVPIPVRGISIEVGLSVGIAFCPEHATTAEELLRHADVAMYSAKRRNSRYEYYSRDADGHSVRRLSMVSDLRSAIALNGIELSFQPQIDLASGELVAAEALLRWEHPVHGRISPEEFIAIAESTDLIQPLTDWTITEALRQHVIWEQYGLAVRVAVNLSARSLQDVDFPRHLEQLLLRFGVQSRWLELEITETAMMLDPQRALEVVRDIQALGVRVAIDDFGTGYSSLGYLRDLRANALKLDKSFVMDLERREHNRVIVESTARMAQALGLEVVAEGIETEWVSRYLAGVGFGIGQGYWFGRPMAADHFFEKFREAASAAAGPQALSA